MTTLSRLALLAAIPLTIAAAANTIYMKDGRTFSGRLIDGNSEIVTFQDDSGREYRFRTGEVQSILFGGPPNTYGRDSANSSAARVLPTGTELSVRTTNSIDSREANDGQVFSAFVNRDVVDASGAVLIPHGSPAELVIRSDNGRSIRESSNLVLDVQSVTVNGQRYLIDTDDVARSGSRDGLGANRRTGEFVGGGTALGTLLGAVAGGGKGALIGALAGAAAGAGTQVLTKGGEVRVPSETVLAFRLDQPITMNPRY